MVFCSLAIWRLGLSYTGIASGSPANRRERPSIYTPSQVTSRDFGDQDRTVYMVMEIL